jgi:hypothetical protein
MTFSLSKEVNIESKVGNELLLVTSEGNDAIMRVISLSTE